MSIIEDLGKRIRGWPAFFIGPAIAGLLGFLFLRYSDWIILALIGGLWLAVVYVFWYIRQVEKGLERSAKGLPVLEPTDEIRFILGILVGIECEYLDRGVLVNSYEAHFKGRSADEFAAVIGVLSGAELIRFYMHDSDKLLITEAGCAYYLTHKRMAGKKG